MNFSEILHQWCPLAKGHHLTILTDDPQLTLASEIAQDCSPFMKTVQFRNISKTPLLSASDLPPHETEDLLIVLLSVETWMSGIHRLLSTFDSPKNWSAFSIMVRLSISRESLLQGILTKKTEIETLIHTLKTQAANKTLRIQNSAGTDLTILTRGFTALPYCCSPQQRHAFLPPSEVYTPLVEGVGEGQIAVDLTAGELRYGPKQIDLLGRCQDPLCIDIRNGQIQGFSGHSFAEILTKEFFSWKENCRLIVELGFGLSNMIPTGLIGVDESILETCHFGFGDNRLYGGNNEAPIHWDVVIQQPFWKIVKEGSSS